MHNYKISVIVPTFNKLNELSLTLNSLINQTVSKEDFEVVIADDGSSEDVKSLLRLYPQINIKYTYQEDKGFRAAKARNMGMLHASGEIYLFIDSGVLLEQTCLQKHIDLHLESVEPLVVLGYTFGMNIKSDLDEMRDIIDNNTINSAIMLMHERDMIDGREPLYKEHGDALYDWPAPWVALWSLHFSVRSSFLIEKKLSFDEYFTHWGCEDNDIGIALYKCGGKFVLDRNIKSIHYPSEKRSYDMFKDPSFKEAFRTNQYYLVNKHQRDDVKMWYEKGMFNVNRLLLEDQNKIE
ncbi:glycosyltransferase [Halalkalibacter sp. APA_J-10(15)]|uniref:glycosyltransferase n=1 Tax=Halalkalibacter sp. APA_J-10(15) TaxID=2933805 RepID=UPI001FF562B1|nr:glycosyltransferase [Halalkalibacter sp. APA_J-10(15)]MCK0473052.1 glycosyltransferase [Halalkalibacter sp. APA_J-10(15)]